MLLLISKPDPNYPCIEATRLVRSVLLLHSGPIGGCCTTVSSLVSMEAMNVGRSIGTTGSITFAQIDWQASVWVNDCTLLTSSLLSKSLLTSWILLQRRALRWYSRASEATVLSLTVQVATSWLISRGRIFVQLVVLMSSISTGTSNSRSGSSLLFVMLRISRCSLILIFMTMEDTADQTWLVSLLFLFVMFADLLIDLLLVCLLLLLCFLSPRLL